MMILLWGVLIHLPAYGQAMIVNCDSMGSSGSVDLAYQRFYMSGNRMDIPGPLHGHQTKPYTGPAWRWARDSFVKPAGGIRKDKWEHFFASAGLYTGLRLFGARENQSIIATGSTGLFWEVKDALVPWETYGFWGGDGFSWRDIVADIYGIIAGFLFWRMVY